MKYAHPDMIQQVFCDVCNCLLAKPTSAQADYDLAEKVTSLLWFLGLSSYQVRL